jgi:prepilin-type N-terminal cleavage/methylation domain-containing protein
MTSRRGGFTLLELLITVALMLALTVATASLFTERRQDAELREAARAIQLLFDRARSEARGGDRSVGVMLERLPGCPLASATLCLADNRGVYSGDGVASRIWVGGPGVTRLTSGDRGWVGLLRPGDLIRFNFRGPLYPLRGHGLDADGRFTEASYPWSVAAELGATPQVPATGVPFQVFLQPTKAAAAALQLPGQAIVDLSASGSSNEFGLSGLAGPVTIVFGRGGAVERVFVGDSSTAPSGPLFLLVGRRAGIAEPFSEPALSNWQDPSSYWVRIDTATGQSSVAECAASGDLASPTDLAGSRQLAAAAAIAPGR